ncbi:MAG: type transport system permease protein [Rhodospirillaceae bacterium]|jgi:ABC-2 type transport system permease protein|nr:type transport system permease protein [Rhodospirillaceae bacterium]
MHGTIRPAPRRIGMVNWLGLWTLYLKEVRRFAKVATQTIVSPLVTTLLFLLIFSLALGRSLQQVGGVSYAQFLVPGLVMMAMAQNAFANTSSSLVISKIQGNIVDLLMPPLSPGELACGLAGGGLTRGLAVGFTSMLAMRLFLPFGIHSWFFILFHAVAASLLLALIGVLAGLWAEKFDQMAAVTNFVITPLSFLSGAFYSTERLPDWGRAIAHLNPFFYMIDGFRYGFIGHADGSLTAGLIVLASADLLLFLAAWRLISKGYRLRP